MTKTDHATIPMEKPPPPSGHGPSELHEGIQLDRKSAVYENQSARFIVSKKTYTQQYAQLYFTRFMLLAPRVRAAVAQQCPNVPVVRTLDLEEGTECVLVGTLNKDMKLKPSILEEYTKERTSGEVVKGSHLVSDSDALALEDENARVALTGASLPVQQLTTGVVVAVRGKALPSGNFEVDQIVFPHPGPQPPLSLPADAARACDPSSKGGRYVALVSGLQLGAATEPLKAQMLIDHLSGLLGGKEEQELAAGVARVIIAGDSLVPSHIISKRLSKQQQIDATASVRELDLSLAQLAAAVPVDIMPGADDFANVSLPQQPMHPCLFPGSSTYSTFNRVTNPYDFDVDSINFLGTSGQNIEDLDKYCYMEDRLDIIEATLHWQHVAPSAPDTLAVYPFVDTDPFIMEKCPHVYFVGNQPAFGTRMVKTGNGDGITRIIALPRFSETGMAVLVNLETLACHPLTFSTDSLLE